MTYYLDGSTYSYFPDERTMVNVAWLGPEHVFPIGHIPTEALDHLFVVAMNQSNVTRGFHNCGLCDVQSPVRLSNVTVPEGVSLGWGELHVRGVDNLVYAAPSLIIHYIMEHSYLPPADFISACLHSTDVRQENASARTNN